MQRTNQHSGSDAKVMCEAMSWPSMRFVVVQNVKQHAILPARRASQGLMKAICVAEQINKNNVSFIEKIEQALQGNNATCCKLQGIDNMLQSAGFNQSSPLGTGN